MGQAASQGEKKTCLYELLGVERTATPEEIRSAYRKLALRCHPDKIQQSGASPEECQAATARFQEISRAYEVLSDPAERAWYDSHRVQILSNSGDGTSAASSSTPSDFDINLWAYFTPSAFSGYSDSGKGFYAVYSRVFAQVHEQELVFARSYDVPAPPSPPPPLGGPDMAYPDVSSFYAFWLSFSTVKDFSWCDEYNTASAPNRKARRLMDEENAKVRRKARREFNNTVRELAAFVKKRDKRVIARQLEVQLLQKEKEMALKLRRKQEEEEKIRKATQYEEAEWTKILEDDDASDDEDENEEAKNLGSYEWKSSRKDGKDMKESAKSRKEEFYCIVCSKKFRSDKQWKNHERSKKHIERAAALQDSDVDEDGNYAQETAEGLREDGHPSSEPGESLPCNSLNASETVSGLEERDHQSTCRVVDEESEAPIEDKGSVLDHDSDDEDSMLAAMMNSQRSRQQNNAREKSYENDEDVDTSLDHASDDDEESMLAAMLNSQRSRQRDAAREKSLEREESEISDYQSLHSPNTDLPENQPNPLVEDGERGDDSENLDKLGTDEKETQSSGQDTSCTDNLEQGNVFGNGRHAFGSAKDQQLSRRQEKLHKKQVAAIARHKKLVDFSDSHGSLERFLKKDESLGTSVEGEEDAGSEVLHDATKVSLEDDNCDGVKESGAQKQGPSIKPARSSKGSKLDAKPSAAQYDSGKHQAKGKKSKGRSKNASSNTCGTCGEDFESRNLLFKHIDATNHAALKGKH